MANLQSVKIYPPVGIARIGNSPEWFLGPELPFPAPPQLPPDGKYKDAQCRIRRQAQRFYLWGTFDDTSNRELTIADGDIEWTVHLANAKPVFRGEAGGLIDPGPRTLKNANDSATFANGTYTYNGITVEVSLGNAVTDANGHLIVAGGFGKSDTPVGSASNPLNWWLENAGWYDDISDGPVNATITVNGQQFTAVGAWVICPPPRYAPSTYPVITLYDTMRQKAIDLNLLQQPGQPVFTTDIYPILTRAVGITRVAAAVFGSSDHTFLPLVKPPKPIGGDSGTRTTIFNKIADPANPVNLGIPDQPQNMPFLNPADGPLPILNEQDAKPTLRPFQYTQMQRWASGDYLADWPPAVPSTITPDGLTQAALENCIGASFYPGIEASITVKDGSLGYTEAYRFDQTNMKPGDVTKVMARPWQADFTACSGGDTPDGTAWWPTARPDTVIPEGGTTARLWTDSLVNNPQEMVDNWFRLGFIVDKGQGAVETEKFAVCKDCFIITARNEIGQEEAQGLINTNQSITDAFYVVVEGFSPNDLGITSPNPNPIPAVVGISLNPTPVGMTQQVDSLLLEDNNALGQAQRITFGFQISFQNTNDFTSDRVP
ncbi:MAG TPA: LodA/GoxA family CTQ-dependent oxidase, partial [Vicinamibacterales bacterium]